MYFVRTKNKYLGNTVLRITECNVTGGRVVKSMVNISGPVLSAGPLTATRRLAGGGGGAASSPPRSRDSTPGIPPLTIAHGAQVHAASGGAVGKAQQRPLPTPGERAASAESRRKVR